MELRLKNFQSWHECNLNVKGFTTIVGDTNLGKSSIFRAVKAIMRNKLPANYIKHGNTSVSVGLDDITISRTSKGTPSYVVGEQKYDKLAGETPKEILDKGLGEVKVGEFSFDPIFASQFDPQFGLSWTPSQVNLVLGAFSATDKLEQGKKEANKRITEINSEAKLLAKEITELEAKLIKIEDLDVKTKELNEELDRLTQHHSLFSNQENFLNEVILVVEDTTYLNDVKAAIGSPVGLQEVITENLKTEQLTYIIETSRDLTLLSHTLLELGNIGEVCDTLIKVSTLSDHVVLLKALEKFKQNINTNIVFLEEMKQQPLTPIQPSLPIIVSTIHTLINVVGDQRVLLGLLGEIESSTTAPLIKNMNVNQIIISLLDKLLGLKVTKVPVVPGFEFPNTLPVKLLENLVDLRCEINSKNKEANLHDEELTSILKEITLLLEERDQEECPECGATFKGKRIRNV